MKTSIKLNKKIFWDVDFKSLNWQKDKIFIINRVLNFGDINDYQTIKKIYGKNYLKKQFGRIGLIDKKNLNFWCLIFNFPLTKCRKILSAKKLPAFWQR